MLQSWLPRTLSLLLVFTTAAVRAANPASSELWTLVGCDDVDLDSIVLNAAHLANAAILAIDSITGGALIGDGDGSDEWYNARNAMLFWGAEFADVADDKVQFQGEALNVLAQVKSKH
jgi:hypothetical protein